MISFFYSTQSNEMKTLGFSIFLIEYSKKKNSIRTEFGKFYIRNSENKSFEQLEHQSNQNWSLGHNLKLVQKHGLFGPRDNKNPKNTPKISLSRLFSILVWAAEISFFGLRIGHHWIRESNNIYNYKAFKK